MTAQDVLTQLPNGLHDASMLAMSIDFQDASVELRLELWVGDEDADSDEGREATRFGVLRLTGIRSMIVDPPLAGRRFSRTEGVDVNGGFGDLPGDGPHLPDAPVKLWLFVETWDARVLIAAADCEFSWSP